MLNYCYANLMDGADSEQRARIDAALEGRIGEGGGIVIDDPDLPQSLQGMEAPSWWDSDHNPMSDMQTVG